MQFYYVHNLCFIIKFMLHFIQSQQIAIDAFKTFLESDERVFMLKGAAGTGKTTLASEFLNL